MTRPLRDGDRITVVHGGDTYLASVYTSTLSREGWRRWISLWSYTGAAGDIHRDDEGTTWVHGYLYKWWSPHRSRIRSLLTASMLADSREKPDLYTALPKITKQFNKAFRSDAAKLQKDIDKIFSDMNKIIGDATKLKP